MTAARRAATVLLAILVLAGCEAQRLAHRGGRALEANRGPEALRYLEAAAREDPGLADEPEFRARLERARYLAAYQEGVRLARSGRPEAAVASLERALDLRPASIDARRELAEARRDAAARRHASALDRADRGDLDGALAELQQARRFDPDSGDVRRALGSLGKVTVEAGPANELYHQAIMLETQHRWGAAAATFRQAVETDGNHLPSRAELHRSNQQLQQARAHYEQATDQLRRKSLDEAIVSLQRALDVWPHYAEARQMLDDATARREKAERLYESAARHLEAGRWDEAIFAGDEALAIFAFHKPAQRTIWEARQAAANARTADGQDLLAAGRLDEADAAFEKALGYHNAHRPAKEGLAHADRLRGRHAEHHGLWGAAMLHYMNANDHVPDQVGLHAIGAARARLRARAAFRATLQVPGGLGDRAPAAVALRDATAVQLAGRTPPFLTFVHGPAAAGADYVAAVGLDSLRLGVRRIGTDRHVHTYIVTREVPNPVIPRLRREVLAARRHLEHLRREVAKSCSQCTGRGHEGGHDDVRAAERRLALLRHRLASTPPTVFAEFEEQYLYTVSHHERFGEAQARVEVVRAADRARLASEPLTKGVAYQDSMIDNPYPAVGLAEDPLVFPPDARIEGELVSALAADAAEKLVATLVQARIADLRAEADRLRRHGDPLSAIELEVDAAELAESLDPSAAKRALDALRRDLPPVPPPAEGNRPI